METISNSLADASISTSEHEESGQSKETSAVAEKSISRQQESSTSLKEKGIASQGASLSMHPERVNQTADRVLEVTSTQESAKTQPSLLSDTKPSSEEELKLHLRDSFIPAIEGASTSREFFQLLSQFSKYTELSKTLKQSPEIQQLLADAEFKLFFLDVRASNNPENIAISREYFELFYLIPALQNAKTPEDLERLQPFVEACIALETHGSDAPSQKDAALKTHLEMKKLFEEKSNSLSPKLQRNRSIEAIQAKILKLDPRSPYFKKDIIDIKSEIRKLRSLPGVPANEFDHLERALDILRDPKPLAISPKEKAFMEHLAKKSGISETQLEDYAKLEHATSSDAQSMLLKALKENVANPTKLNTAAKKASNAAIASAKQNRFRRFADVHSFSPALNQNFAQNFPAVISAFEKFSREFEEEFKDCYTLLEKTHDDQTNGQFSRHLQVLSYADPRTSSERFELEAQARFLESLDLQVIDEAAPKTLNRYLIKTLKTKPDAYGYYEHSFFQTHSWLVRNSNNIKNIYNHSKESIYCCKNNCLRRASQFASDPTFDRSRVQMGSTLSTRKHQAALETAHKDSQKGLISHSEYMKMRTEAHLKYDLEKTHVHPVSQEDIGKQIEKFSQLGDKQALLILESSSNSSAIGHAINLHFDQINRVYGFEDDNIGRVEFSSLEEMKTELDAYSKAFYSHMYDSLSLEFYEASQPTAPDLFSMNEGDGDFNLSFNPNTRLIFSY
ncbi:MAG: hypothetical protein KFB93_05130 [Simkaniaceae bacterium]|nr:MAG: hypothetical protein KFB93_05130 [Simkaniaceae bacterium]